MLIFVILGVLALAVVIAVGVIMAQGATKARQSGADVQAAGRVDVIERPRSPG